MKRRTIIIIVLSVIAATATTVLIIKANGKPEFELEELRLTMDDESFEKLDNFRSEALEKGFLERSDNDYVPATVEYLGQTIDCTTRLKGDWTDHLGHKKYSFRIKLNEAMEDGLEVFSIQTPMVRDFMNGYVFHELLRDEGVLVNEYRFVELILNDESWGMYCLEEHLTSRLYEKQGRPEGVIYKFKDDLFFQYSMDSMSVDGLIKRSDIKGYGDFKKDDRADLGKEIMERYKFQVPGWTEHFNDTAMAKFYALCDLATAYHAMGWINIRFYYNFENQLMEPIGYDAYPILEWGKPTLGHNSEVVQLDTFITEMIVYEALRDSSIMAEYDKVLDRVSQEDYVNAFMDKHVKDIKFYEEQLQKEFKDYKYDYDFLPNRAKEIREFRSNR